MRSPLSLLKNMAAFPVDATFSYEDFKFALPLTAQNVNDNFINDRYDFLDFMYLGTTTSNGYVLGTPIPFILGRTFSLSGTDAARVAISSIGVLTLADNTGLAAGTLSFNIVVNDLGAIPITIPVVSPTGNAVFFDSVNGNDANSGRQPHLPKATFSDAFISGVTVYAIRRGSEYIFTLQHSSGRTYCSYGDPSVARPQIRGVVGELYCVRNGYKTAGVPGSGFASFTSCSYFDLDFVGNLNTTQVVFNAYNFSGTITAKRCSATGNISNANSSVFRAYVGANAVFRHNDIQVYYGDGIYCTQMSGTIECGFNLIKPPFGGAADCIQITGENDFAQRCKNIQIHHNILDYGRHSWTGSGKGSCVAQESDRVCFEYNLCRGGYFGFGRGSNRLTERYNYYYDCNFYNPINTNTWGTGAGSDQPNGEHTSVANIVNGARRGISISGYPRTGATQRWDRTDFVHLYDTIMNCNEAAKATERWSGLYKCLHINNYNQQFQLNAGFGDVAASVVKNVYRLSQVGGVATLVVDSAQFEHTIRPDDSITIAGAIEAGYNVTVDVATVPSSITGTVTSLTQTAGLAIAEFDKPHGYKVGNSVTFAGSTPTAFNGAKTVTSVPTPTSLTFAIASGTASPATGTITTSMNSKCILTFPIDAGVPSIATGTITVTKNLEFATQTVVVTEQLGVGPTLNVIPTITGTCQDGQTVTCNTTAQVGITYEYQWILNEREAASGTSAGFNIPAGTAANINKRMPVLNGLNTTQLGCIVIATDSLGRKSYIPALWDRWIAFKTVVA